jgi:alpha-galactosidase
MQSNDVASQILLNREAIGIDQDAEGAMARQINNAGMTQVWTKPLTGGDQAVLLVNTGETPTDITVDLGALGLSASRHVRDVWTHADAGAFTGSYTAPSVAPHASVLVRVAGQSQ